MPRTSSATARARTGAGTVVGQAAELVAANETLKRENAELLAVNEQLRAQLLDIGSALGRLTGGPRRRGRGGAKLAVVAGAKPKRVRPTAPRTPPVHAAARRMTPHASLPRTT